MKSSTTTLNKSETQQIMTKTGPLPGEAHKSPRITAWRAPPKLEPQLPGS